MHSAVEEGLTTDRRPAQMLFVEWSWVTTCVCLVFDWWAIADFRHHIPGHVDGVIHVSVQFLRNNGVTITVVYYITVWQNWCFSCFYISRFWKAITCEIHNWGPCVLKVKDNLKKKKIIIINHSSDTNSSKVMVFRTIGPFEITRVGFSALGYVINHTMSFKLSLYIHKHIIWKHHIPHEPLNVKKVWQWPMARYSIY